MPSKMNHARSGAPFASSRRASSRTAGSPSQQLAPLDRLVGATEARIWKLVKEVLQQRHRRGQLSFVGPPSACPQCPDILRDWRADTVEAFWQPEELAQPARSSRSALDELEEHRRYARPG